MLKDMRPEEIKLACGWSLTIMTDDFLSALKIQLPEVRVIEGPFLGTPDFENRSFSEIQVNTTDGAIQLFKSTIAGTTIYYHINSAGEFFCSTHISMLRKAGVSIDENRDALPEFFVYRIVMAPRTLFKDINQIAAGSRVLLKRRARGYEVAKVADYEPPTPDKTRGAYSLRNTAASTRSILGETVRPLSTIQDKVAVPLSGGLDSSILLKICKENFDVDSTFSTGWPLQNGHPNTEREYATSAAEAFGTGHRYHEVTVEDYLHGFLEAIVAAEEPLHHLQSVLLYRLFRDGIPQSKTLVISGEGADSVFGSEFNHNLFRSRRGIRKILLSTPISNLVELAGFVSPLAKRITANGKTLQKQDIPLSDPGNVIWSVGAYGSVDWTCSRFNTNKQDIIESRYSRLRSFENRSTYELASIVTLLASVWAAKGIWSKLGEYNRRILYYPYTAPEMLTFIYQIPWEIKLQRPKNVLRQVGSDLKIPTLILTRPKSSFGVEPKYWAVPGGWFEPLIPMTAKVLPEKDIRLLQSTSLESAHTFWNLLNYTIWQRIMINNETLSSLTSELSEGLSRSMRTN
jgi:asparagine synthetase B (glutamine-hydrolysing)